jgi:opacity protein-like surface antigen
MAVASCKKRRRDMFGEIMRNSSSVFAAVVLLASMGLLSQAGAEPYAGVSVGFGFGQKVTSVKGDENTNYPDPPTADPTDAPLLKNAKISDLKVANTPLVSFKAGYFFSQIPFLGVEGELSYLRPDFKRQDVTLSHPGFDPLVGMNSITEHQLPVRTDLFVLALNAIYRYQGVKDITPYVGGGPALFLWRIHGTGFSGIVPSLDMPGTPGPRINETSLDFGFDLKAGVEYSLSQEWALGLEYRFQWSRVNFDNFRSVSNASGNYHGHALSLTVVRHF